MAYEIDFQQLTDLDWSFIGGEDPLGGLQLDASRPAEVGLGFQSANCLPGETKSPTINTHTCTAPSCTEVYKRKGDLTRHQQEKHAAAGPGRFVCPVELCPRSIRGNGFARNHQLTSHLKSKKHGMSAEKAAYEAAKHNMGKDKAKASADGEGDRE